MFALIDTHVHLWNPERMRYPWLEEVPALKRPFLLPDYHAAAGAATLKKYIFIECGADSTQRLAEIGWATELAQQDPRLCGIVASAPVETGAEVEASFAAFAQNPLIRGVRRLLQGEPEADFCLRPEFVAGVRLLAGFGLSFDLCIRHDQLPAATELVRRCPEVAFVLDHLGKPPVRQGTLEPWKNDLSALAKLPNVCCKISGLATEANWEKWQLAELKPWLDHALNCFGFERVMFGSDWPVCTLATTWRRWLDILQDTIASARDAERRRFFHDNAERFYRV